MNLDDATAEFNKRLRSAFPDSTPRVSFGGSNAAFKIEGGVRLGNFNLEDAKGLSREKPPLVLACRLILPPDRVLFLALVLSGETLNEVQARRGAIITDKGKANNVRCYLHKNGIYLASQEFTSLAQVPAAAGSPLQATTVLFTDVSHESDLNPVEAIYVQYLESLIGNVPLKRLGPNGTVVERTVSSPGSLPIETLEGRIVDLNAYYDRSLIERYHVALNHLTRKHFVLLTGISGTGKTLLAKSYAYAVLGLSSLKLPSDSFHLIPVRPDWTEPAHLLGFMDAVSGTYHRTRFTDALLRAFHNPTQPVFVCLDEMNLAQPEHYFADLLSAMETGEPIHLHSSRSEREVPERIPWPENLFITGTVNVDETTRPFSPKVLDRANVIDMSEADVRGFCAKLLSREPGLSAGLTPDVIDLLTTLNTILSQSHLHFGYRVVEEIARYLTFSTNNGVLHTALDVQVNQKVLTKLKGGPEQERMLKDLDEALKGFPQSHATVQRMKQDLQNYESFQYWR